MKLSHDFLLKILRSVPASVVENDTMHLIVQRPYDHLIEELQGVFGEQDEVEVKIDTRADDRRRDEKPFPQERRQRERRKPNYTLVEIVISA